MQRENERSCYKKSLSSPNVSIGDLQRTLRFVMKQQTTCVEDSRLRPSGMTGPFYHGNNAFTLIELLVVVLIIGILAAVALPQYQKAVERARASEAFPLLKAVQQAAQTHYLANGDYPEKFDELAVEIPWTGTTKWRTRGAMKDTRSNDLWSFQLYKETGFQGNVTLGRISGKYEGVGFEIGIANGHWGCVEKTSEGKVFSGSAGDYCVKIMRCADTHETYNNGRYYTSCPF